MFSECDLCQKEKSSLLHFIKHVKHDNLDKFSHAVRRSMYVATLMDTITTARTAVQIGSQHTHR